MKTFRGSMRDWMRPCRLWMVMGILAVAGRGAAAPAVVVAGHASVAASERRFVLALSKHVERWYGEAGVPCVAADDRDLDRALAGKKVAVLVSLTSPGAAQIAALRVFVQRGGKLIVCYSSSPELAALMGVKCIGYQRGSTDGRWSQMRFTGTAPQGVPEVVLQTSANLFLVQPIQGQSTVLAWWHDREGRQTTEPAWLASHAGYWMTHVLSGDGDTEAKSRLMLALTAAHDPSLWVTAAHYKLNQARTACGTEGPHPLKMRAEKLSDPARRGRATAAAMGAEKADARAQELLAMRRGYEAWETANELRGRMFDVYGLLQAPRAGEIRAIWDHSGQGIYPGNWAKTCRLLKDAGFTDLYVNVAGAGFAHYASSVLPRSRVVEEQGDQLQACLDAARPVGLRVHAWILCFSTEGISNDRLELFRKRGWLLTAEDGSPRPWLDPGVPAARAYLVDAIREMATRYAVTGIHLDFVRYPDFNSSLGPSVRAAFEKQLGKKLPNWPEEVKTGGAARAAFLRWRINAVSDFVQAARRTVKREASGKVMSAAVFGKYPSCADAVGQDWEAWLKLGLLDYVAPMNYTEDQGRYVEWLAQQTRTRTQAMKIISGIGVTAAESRLTPAEVMDQIQAARRAGAAGFALFKLDTAVRKDVLPVLRLGVTAPIQ